MSGIDSYSTTAASNTTVGGANVAEGTSPGNINDAIRGLASELRKGFDDMGGRVVSSGTNTITLTTQSTFTAYATGMRLAFEAGGTNTGAATVNVDGVGAQDLKCYVGATLRALVGGEIVTGNMYDILWEATNSDFILLNPTAVPVAFAAHKNGSDQASITASTYTLVTFGTELFDTHGYFAANRFTPLIAGKYAFSGNLMYSGGVVDQAIFKCALYKNGSLAAEGQSHASGTSNLSACVDYTATANGTTDYFEIYAYGSGAGTKTVKGDATASWFTGRRLT
jgi:hypothetical protein